MAAKQKVKHVWNKMSALESAAYARGTVTGMTAAAATFPTPPVALAAISTAAQRIENAWANRMNGPAAQEELRLAVEDMAKKNGQQADYVDGVALGNVAKILSAGMSATSADKTPAVPPAAPASLKITPLGPCAIRIRAAKVDNAKAYCYIIYLGAPFTVPVVGASLQVPASATPYVLRPNGTSLEEFTNLPSGTQVTVRVLAMNAAGYSSWSAAESTFVL